MKAFGSIYRLGMLILIVGPLVFSCTASREGDAAARTRVEAALAGLPLYFIENQGQIDGRVRYYVQGRDTDLYFTSQGLTFALSGASRPSLLKTSAQDSARQGWVLKLGFKGANPEVRPAGLETTSATVSYFKGPEEQWKTSLPTFNAIVYRDLWPGIDLEYSGTANQLKYTFVVKPGADPGQIRLAYRGATEVKTTDRGTLEVMTPAGGFEDDKPLAYQESDGQPIELAAGYALEGRDDDGEYEYGFHVGAYDRSRPLVIDPAILVYAGFIGGSDADAGWSIAVDQFASAYVTGATDSAAASFPETVGPDLTHNGDRDAFVAKVTLSGTALIYAGYFGGDGFDIGTDIAVNALGNAYITGQTNSTQDTFPVAVGPDLTFNGGGDAFVVKLNAAGDAFLYAGYIGGDGPDCAATCGIAVDPSGNAYIAGDTQSSSGFPATIGPDLTYNDAGDAFVAKVNASGTALYYAGYIGGAGNEGASDIAVDSLGNAYVVGSTNSAEDTFPVTMGPDLTFNGAADAFVAKVNAAGTALSYAGYIGGSGYDHGEGIAVDSSGNAHVIGTTSSSEATFPVSVGPDLTYNFGGDAFVAKLNPTGTGLSYAGYIGGTGSEYGYDIAVDAFGSTYVTGSTDSSHTSFPVVEGPDLTFNGGSDAFVAKINPTGTAFSYAGYIGGSSYDTGYGIAVYNSGSAYITGVTSSDEATFPVLMGPDATSNGYDDAFVSRVGVPDGTADWFGGEFIDSCFPCPPGPPPVFRVGRDIIRTVVHIFIDVISTPHVAPPRGYSGPATFFVDFTLVPNQNPLPSPGAAIELPLTSPLPPGTRLVLFEFDPARNALISRGVAGAVNRGGTAATFSGITKFSVFAGYQAGR